MFSYIWLFSACVSFGSREKILGSRSGIIWCLWKGTDIIFLPGNLGWSTYMRSHIVVHKENTTCPIPILQGDSESFLTLILQICPLDTALLTGKNGSQNSGFILSSWVQTILRQMRLFLPSDNCGNSLPLFHTVSPISKWVSCFYFGQAVTAPVSYSVKNCELWINKLCVGPLPLLELDSFKNGMIRRNLSQRFSFMHLYWM